MKSFFYPVMYWVGRLSFRQKLWVGACFSFLPVLLLGGWLLWRELAELRKLEQQHAFLSVQMPVLEFGVQLSQQALRVQPLVERGETAGSAPGFIAYQNQQAASTAAETAVQHAVSRMPLLPELVASWQEVRAGLQGLSSAEAFTLGRSDLVNRYRDVIQQTLEWQEAVVVAGGLRLRQDEASYVLAADLTGQLPMLLNDVSRASVLASAALAEQRLTSAQRKELLLIRSRLDPALSALADHQHKLAVLRPEQVAGLEAARSALDQQVMGLTEALTTKVLDTSELDTPADTLAEQGTQAMRALLALAQANQAMQDDLLAEHQTRVQREMLGIAGGILLLFVLLLYGFTGTYLSILGSVHGLTHAAQQLAQGDLRVRVESSTQDELATVADALNFMAEGFSELIGQVNQAIGQVTQTVVMLEAQGTRVQRASLEQSSTAERTAAAIEELTVSVHEVADHSRDSHALANETSDLCVHGQSDAAQAQAVMGNTVRLVHTTMESMNRLSERSAGIGQIVKVIDEIAQQTNLLALNAAIEAARAGEHGRGFSVVADEVRKLADRTSVSTREISERIGAISQEVQDAVHTMQTNEEHVSRSADAFAGLVSLLGEISQRVNASVNHAQEIALATDNQSQASTDVAQNMQAVAVMAEENHQAITQTTETLANLRGLAQGLRQSIERLKVA